MNCEYSKMMEKKISALRLAKRLTQEGLSTRLQVTGCDLTRSALAKIEVGQYHLYPDEIKALETAFGAGYEELFV